MTNKYFGWLLMAFLILTACNTKQNVEIKKYPLGYDEPVRGVWLTNVASEALYSRENIIEVVEKCKSLGINTIFVVTWNKGMTTYRSEIMKNFTGIEIDPKLDPNGTGRDPLQEIIVESHKRGIKVFAWFEFGFSSSYSENGGKIASLKPEWVSLTNDGEICTKNNFDWLNALDPEVQNFMSSLVLEVIKKYQIDGIQGDDRLPAMPSICGYNPKVIDLYKKEHFGESPPSNYKDFEWVNWRAEKLNEYLKNLYKAVKKEDPNCIVSMAPSVYPWSKEEYLQDWPDWVNFGYVDMICPQVYRKDSMSYKKTLENTLLHIIPEKRHLMFPGILIQVNDEVPSEEFFKYMLDENRALGINGEVLFFYEGINIFHNEIRKAYK